MTNKNFNGDCSNQPGSSFFLKDATSSTNSNTTRNDYGLEAEREPKKLNSPLHVYPLLISGSDVQSKSPQTSLTAHLDDLVFLSVLPYSKPPSQPLNDAFGCELFIGKNTFERVSEKRTRCGTEDRELILRNPCGVEIEELSLPDKDFESNCKYRYTLPGCFLSSLPSLILCRALKTFLVSPGVTITRVDLAIDIYNDINFYKRIGKAYNDGNFVGFKKGSTYDSDSFKKGQRTSKGKTIYFGTRGSNKLIRVYDKGLQLGENTPHIRYELQLRDNHASQVIKDIINSGTPDNLEYIIAKIATSEKYINFMDRTKNKQACRCPDLKWWCKFLKDIEVLNKVHICN